MRVHLGQDVFDQDGQMIGTVDRLVVDTENELVTAFIIDPGFFSNQDKIIAESMIADTNTDGVFLNITKETVKELPTYVTTNVYTPRSDATDSRPFIVPNAAGGLIYDDPTTGIGYPNAGSLYDPAPIDPPVMETERNLPVFDVLLSKSTEVVDRDNHKLGTVHDLLFDERGVLDGLIVKEGLLFTHELSIAREWIAAIGSDTITLNVTREQVEAGS